MDKCPCESSGQPLLSSARSLHPIPSTNTPPAILPSLSRVPSPSHWVLPIPMHTCCYFFHFRNPLSTGLTLPVAIPFLSFSLQQRCLKSCVCLGSPVPQLLVTLESMSISVDFAYRVPLELLSCATAIHPVANSQPPIQSTLGTPLACTSFQSHLLDFLLFRISKWWRAEEPSPGPLLCSPLMSSARLMALNRPSIH